MQLTALASEGYVNSNHVLNMISYVEENRSKKIARDWTGWLKLKIYYIVLVLLNSSLKYKVIEQALAFVEKQLQDYLCAKINHNSLILNYTKKFTLLTRSAYVFLSVNQTEYLTHIYASCSLDEARLKELATPIKPLDKPLNTLGASYEYLS